MSFEQKLLFLNKKQGEPEPVKLEEMMKMSQDVSDNDEVTEDMIKKVERQ